MKGLRQRADMWNLGSLVLLLVAGAATAQKPAPAKNANVYQTKDSFTAAYHYLTCLAETMPTPTSTAEVAAVVKQAYAKAKSGTPVTLRVSRPKFHSTATFVCPVAPPLASAVAPAAVTTERAAWTDAKGKMSPQTIGVLQSKLNKVLAVDKEKFTMRVQAGMRINEFLPAATKAGLSVQIGSLPAYAGLTLAGVLLTSAHGSGDQTISSLADTVLEVTWVDGTGEVHTSKRSDPEFRAFHGSLGVFGVVTELLIQLTPPTNTQLITVVKDDKNLMDEINKLLKVSPHILIHWRPDSGRFKAFLTKEAAAGSKAASGVNMTVLPNIQNQASMAAAFNIWHADSVNEDSDMSDFLCQQVTDASISASWAMVNGKAVMNVTGPTNSMQASECDEHCTWNDRKVFNGTAVDAEFTIDFAALADWIDDVKRVFNVELKENGKAAFRCMGLGYMWIRFGKMYDGFTATNTGLFRPVYVQSTWMRSRVGKEFAFRYQFVTDLVEELTLCKYKGRPHWGKNFDRTFTHPRCPVVPLYPKFNQLMQLADKYDPENIFVPRLFERMVGKQAFELSPGCSALNKCYCQADIHCPKNHKCVQSLAFPQFKVCKTPMKNVPGELLTKIMLAAVAAK